jgi:hypothetical protein
LSFPFKSGLNIKETTAIISENYFLITPSLENEILTLENENLLSRPVLGKNRFGS